MPVYPPQCPPGLRGTQPGTVSLTCTGTNAVHACAYFQEDSREPTLRPFLLSPDGDNVCLTLPEIMGTEALPLGQGKVTLRVSLIFREVGFTFSYQGFPAAETSLKTDMEQPGFPAP